MQPSDTKTSKSSKIADAEVLAQMERILSSEFFRNAPSLQQFLQYVVQKTLKSEQDEVKEYTIGREVLGRDHSYDPGSDSIVRVQASHLRKRLESYYHQQSARDELIIEFPKGSYIPNFSRPEAPSPVYLNPRRRSGQIVLLAGVFFCGALVMGLAGFFFWSGRPVEELSPRVAPVAFADSILKPVWGRFLETGTPLDLAYGIPVFYWADGLLIRDVEVSRPGSINPDSRLGRLQSHLNVPFILTEDYLPSGDAAATHLLGRFFWSAGKDVKLLRSRIVSWDELKSHNVVFVSCLRTATLANELSFPVDFEYRSTSEIRKRWPTGCIVNLHPQVGEATEYPQQVINGYGQDYALVTIWQGKMPNRHIMVIGGSHPWGTQGAAEYLTNPDYLQGLNWQLEQCARKQGLTEHPPFFQLLLRVEIKDQQPVGASYVTHHDLDVRDRPQSVETSR